MLDLWLIRHAESVGNVDGTNADTDLSPRGREQAQALSPALAGLEVTHVWTSPLSRARQTAALAMPSSVPLVDDRLTELRSGPPAQVLDTSRMTPEAVHAFVSALPRPTFESGKDFMARVKAWRAELPRDGRVIAFTHFGVIREILADLLGFLRAPQEMSHACIFRVTIGAAAPQVIAWNETSHASSPAPPKDNP